MRELGQIWRGSDSWEDPARFARKFGDYRTDAAQFGARFDDSPTDLARDGMQIWPQMHILGRLRHGWAQISQISAGFGSVGRRFGNSRPGSARFGADSTILAEI